MPDTKQGEFMSKINTILSKGKAFFVFGMVLLLSGSVHTLSAQSCKVQGVVRYYHNDFVGWKPDVGAEVWVVPKSKKYPTKLWLAYQDQCERWLQYRKLAKYAYSYQKSMEVSGFIGEDSLLTLSGEVLLQRIYIEDDDNKCILKQALITGDGTYTINVPYGRYYIICKSANRKRNTLLEMNNRYLIYEVTLNSGSKILNFDFDADRIDR